MFPLCPEASDISFGKRSWYDRNITTSYQFNLETDNEHKTSLSSNNGHVSRYCVLSSCSTMAPNSRSADNGVCMSHLISRLPSSSVWLITTLSPESGVVRNHSRYRKWVRQQEQRYNAFDIIYYFLGFVFRANNLKLLNLRLFIRRQFLNRWSNLTIQYFSISIPYTF